MYFKGIFLKMTSSAIDNLFLQYIFKVTIDENNNNSYLYISLSNKPFIRRFSLFTFIYK